MTGSGSTTVLVADDDQLVRLVLQAGLERHGFRVLQAANGDDCVTKIVTSDPALVIMDACMTGTPLLQRIHLCRERHVNTVVLTGALEPVLRDVDLGSNGLLVEKPLDLVGLEHIIAWHRLPLQKWKVTSETTS